MQNAERVPSRSCALSSRLLGGLGSVQATGPMHLSLAAHAQSYHAEATPGRTGRKHDSLAKKNAFDRTRGTGHVEIPPRSMHGSAIYLSA